MNDTIIGITGQFKSCFDQHYLPFVRQQLIEQQQRMVLIFDFVRQFETKRQREILHHLALAKYKQGLYQLVGPMWHLPVEENFFGRFPELEITLRETIEQVPTRVRQEQHIDRFTILPEDSSNLKVLKYMKQFLFGLHQLPFKLRNKWRQPPMKTGYWQHSVALRNLARLCFHINPILRLQSVDHLLLGALSETYLRLKLWEEAVVNREDEDKVETLALNETIQNFAQVTYSRVQAIWQEIYAESVAAFEDGYKKAGTLEYPNGSLKNKALQKSWQQTDSKWSLHLLRWKNTIHALFEEWRSDLDIYKLHHQTLAELDDFQRAQIKRLGEQIGPEVQEIDQMITEMKGSLSGIDQELKKSLTRINYQTRKQLDEQLIPELTEKLSSQYVLNLISKLEINIQKNVEKLSGAHVVVKTRTYDQPMDSVELKRISPYELIAFETLDQFQNDISGVKKGLFETLEQVAEQVSDIDHVITFNIQAALSVLEEVGHSAEGSRRIAIEGLDRAQLRLRESKEILDRNLQLHSNQVAEVTLRFCNRIMELTENENIRELRGRIQKAKSARLREERKKETRLKLESRKEQLTTVLRNTVLRAEHLVEDISERLLLTPGKRLIDKEVSDLLVDSRSIIDRLPQVYQRLYNIEPLKDLELFEGRQTEFQKLGEAFESWKKGRFAATIIFGEKWGGQTSFITYAIHESNYQYPLVRYSLTSPFYTESEFLDLLRQVFRKEDFQSVEEVKDYLGNGPRKVVILEDLQNSFLRCVGGFTGIRILLQFINQTCKEVFWVTTITLYSWQYLSKTIAMHDFFSYAIAMQTLTDEQVTSIIWKRNRISGYKIQFLPSSKRSGDHKFKNLPVEDQQLVLKRDFFAALNGFADSNISLALIFWLLSTREVKGDSLLMGEFKKPDFSFMSALSSEKIHLLNGLIIHDGLDEFQLQRVLNVAAGALQLTLLSLLEDGILFFKDGIYMVNPMLYRTTVAMLKDKNLVH